MLDENTMRFNVQFSTTWGPMFTYGYRYLVDEDLVMPPSMYFPKTKSSMRFVKWPKDVMVAITRRAKAAYYRRKHDLDSGAGDSPTILDPLDR